MDTSALDDLQTTLHLLHRAYDVRLERWTPRAAFEWTPVTDWLMERPERLLVGQPAGFYRWVGRDGEPRGRTMLYPGHGDRVIVRTDGRDPCDLDVWWNGGH